MANRKRILPCLLVIALLSISLVSTTQTANAGSDYGASNWAIQALKIAGRVAAAVAIQRLTNDILAKIQKSGPNGGPGFIQNWINFTTNSQYQGEGIFRAELGKATLCSYFSDSLKSLFGAGKGADLPGQNTRTNNLDPFSVRSNCTMPATFNIADYQKDFSGNGGWAAWSRMLEPQNNYYGSLFQSLDEVSAQRALANKSNTAKATAGQGVLGPEKDCNLIVANQCLIPGNIKTPGSIVGQSVTNALDSATKFLAASDDSAANSAIGTVVTLVVKKIFDLAEAPGDNTDFSIPSPQRTADSYKQEFCMAENNISPDAGMWIKNKYPQAWTNFPVEHPGCNGHANLFGHHDDACGKSYCELVREEFNKNSYPYSRCTESCMNAIKNPLPPGALPPAEFNPYPLLPPGGGLTCADVPTAKACTAPNHAALVFAVKTYVVNNGISILGNCGAFEITKRVAWALRGEGGGYLTTPHSGNCNGLAAGIVSYSPDHSEVDILRNEGGPEIPVPPETVPGNIPQWNPGPPNNEVGISWVAPINPGDPAGSY